MRHCCVKFSTMNNSRPAGSITPFAFLVVAVIGALFGGTFGWAESLSELRDKAYKGDANAQVDLAACFMSGEGVQSDVSEAVTWLRRAAEQGNVRAQSNLGILFIQNYGV